MPRFDPLSRALGAVAALLGTVAAAWYWSAGLTLSHYDAKAHLVVARRILDSLTPSWEQIGAVWLPLPHLLNALPVQIDWMYQTGASAIFISIVSFAVTVACLSALVLRVTGSPWGAALAAALFAANPNVLYLQSTPMTEPLLFALSSLVVLHLAQWALSDAVAV
ncbi:MAG: family 2 glycosyl transferase, partial [Acidobacteriota bacterium]|nr:family 2 glycosyl transferase [Acidobacteriota bacterium]